MLERRKTQRRKFSYYMRVADNATLKPVGHLMDISTSGFKIDSPVPLPVGVDYNLRLDLTNDIADKNYMVFVARSKWCKMDRLDPTTQNVGFEIVRMNLQDASIFRRIVERYAV